MRERQQEIDEALCNSRPFDVPQRLQGAGGCVQQSREHVGKTGGRDDAGFGRDRPADEAAVPRFGCNREDDRAHIALEHQAPVAMPRQQQEMADGNDTVARALPQHHTVLDREQRDRQSLARLRQRRDPLRSRRDSGQRHAHGVAMRGRRVTVVECACGSRLQADRSQDVPPCLQAVVSRVRIHS